MFPIGDDDVRGGRPEIVNIMLIAINVLVFLYELTLSPAGLQEFVTQYGVVPERILAGQQLSTLVTSMFIHGGWLHIISNMLFLWVFGDNIEAVLGHVGYLLFYLLGGVVASLAHVLASGSSSIPSIGASGAIAAALGAYIVMFPESRIRVLYFIGLFFGITRLSALFFLGLWAVMQLFNGIASLGVDTAQTGGVAVWAHVGGFAFGLLPGLLFRSAAQRRGLTRR